MTVERIALEPCQPTPRRLAAISCGLLLFAGCLGGLGPSRAAAQALESSVAACRGPTNLIIGATTSAPDVKGMLSAVSDGFIAMEGAFWSGGESVVLPKDVPALRYDL